MIDQDFCKTLEAELSKTFIQSDDNSVNHFWCDGVMMTQSKFLSKKEVNDKRHISMTAFLGPTGQDKYELVLNFGPKALSKYSRGLAIKECIPSSSEMTWFHLDCANKIIIVQLL